MVDDHLKTITELLLKSMRMSGASDNADHICSKNPERALERLLDSFSLQVFIGVAGDNFHRYGTLIKGPSFSHFSTADKAAALASYAKQSQDDELMKYAVRIRDRAIRRCGELLKQVDPGKGGRPSTNSGVERPSFEGWVPGTDPNAQTLEGWVPQTRKDAAEAAGLNEYQKKQALRVANVPAADFEKQVESPTPLTAPRH